MLWAKDSDVPRVSDLSDREHPVWRPLPVLSNSIRS